MKEKEIKEEKDEKKSLHFFHGICVGLKLACNVMMELMQTINEKHTNQAKYYVACAGDVMIRMLEEANKTYEEVKKELEEETEES